jgi:hypothetical protein
MTEPIQYPPHNVILPGNTKTSSPVCDKATDKREPTQASKPDAWRDRVADDIEYYHCVQVRIPFTRSFRFR